MNSTNLMLAFIPLVLVAAGVAALALQHRQTRRETQAAAAEAHAALWRDRPLPALQARWQHFVQHLRTLRAGAEEKRRQATAAEERHDRYRKAIRGGRPVTPVYAVVVSTLGAFWLVVFALQIVLDVMILRGLHPTDLALSLSLGTAAALGIAGLAMLLVVIFGGHDGVVPVPRSPSAKRLVGLFGAALLVIIVGTLVVIAPARSQLAEGRAVTDREKVLAETRTLQPPDPLAEQAAEADLAAARQRLDKAEAVDRAYALLMPTFEVALSVPAVAAAELLMLGAASRRAQRRQREARAADSKAGAALDAWTADVTDELVRFGHGQDVLHTFFAQLDRSRQASAPSTPEPGAAPFATPAGDPAQRPFSTDEQDTQLPPGHPSRIGLTAVPDQPGGAPVDPAAAQPDDSEWDESA